MGRKDETHPLPGLMSAFQFTASENGEELPASQAALPPTGGFIWLHFNAADPGTATSVRSLSGLSAAAKDMLGDDEQRQQLYADEASIFGVFANLFGEADSAGNIRFVRFAVTKDTLVTCSRSQLDSMSAIRDMLARGEMISRTSDLVEIIVGSTLDHADDYLKVLGEKLDNTEEQVLSDEPGDQRQMLVQVRRSTIRLSRQIAISLSLIRRFDNELSRRGTVPVHLATDKLAQRLDWLNSETVAIRERAHLLQDEVILKTADQTNRHLQVLAIVATVFLPASLIAGIFGMNVKGLPLTDISSGFLWSMLLLTGASVFVFWLLKRSGILDS
jgi:zinc transporter